MDNEKQITKVLHLSEHKGRTLSYLVEFIYVFLLRSHVQFFLHHLARKGGVEAVQADADARGQRAG